MTNHRKFLTYYTQALTFLDHATHNRHREPYRVNAGLRILQMNINNYFNHLYLHLNGVPTMAKKTYGNLTFTNVYMSESQLADLDKQYTAILEHLDEYLAVTISEGCKISVNYSTQGSAFYCTLITADTHKQSPNMGFSSFSNEPLDAIVLTLYKYRVIIKGDLSRGQSDAHRQRG